MKKYTDKEILGIRLQGKMLGANLELQQMQEVLSKSIEEREFMKVSRFTEIEEILEHEDNTFDEDTIETVINEIGIMEEEIQELLGLNAKCLRLDEVLDLNSKIKEYKLAKENADLFDSIIAEFEAEDTDDKKIYCYDFLMREFNELKYDEKYYFLLSKLNIVEHNGTLLYMKGLHEYGDLLHMIFDKDYTTFITHKSDNLYDIREENLEFTSFGQELEQIQDEVAKAKKGIDEIKVINSDEVSATLRAMVNEKAKEVEELLSESEEILGKSVEELMEEHNIEIDRDEEEDDK